MKYIFHFFTPFVLTMFLVFCLGCYLQCYYRTNTSYKVSGPSLNQLRAANKYFILHTPDGVFSLNNMSICGETLSGETSQLKSEYLKYLNPSTGMGNRFPGREEDIVLSEVHVYTNRSFANRDTVSFTADQIYRMDIYVLDQASSEGMKLLSSVGFTLGIAIVVGGNFIAGKGAGLSFK